MWDLYIIRLRGAGGGAMINKNLSSKLVNKLVPGREFNKFDYRIRPPYAFYKKPRPFQKPIGTQMDLMC